MNGTISTRCAIETQHETSPIATRIANNRSASRRPRALESAHSAANSTTYPRCATRNEANDAPLTSSEANETTSTAP